MNGSDATISRRRFLRTFMVGAAGVALLGGEAVREAYDFRISRQTRVIRGLQRPLRASMLTDFHLGPYVHEANLIQWVQASNEAEPDIVFIVGDLVDQWYRGDLSELLRWLPQLAAPLGVHVVPGNHDYSCYPDLQPLRRALQTAGASFLINRGGWVRDDVYLAGVDDVLEGAPDPPAALAMAGDEQGAHILLSHNPDIIPELPAGVDLVLSGHTHGGQICIPFLGAVVTSSAYGRRFASGWVRADMPAFVSRGLGVALVPMRLACPPEVVILDLQPI